MKKANYYEIHKNKKPNRLIKKSNRFKSMVVPLIVATSAISAVQIANIQSQPMSKDISVNLNKIDKLSLITEITKNKINAFSKIIKSEQQRRFKLTKRYVK